MSKPTIYKCAECDKPVKLDPRGRFRKHQKPGFRITCSGTWKLPVNLALFK